MARVHGAEMKRRSSHELSGLATRCRHRDPERQRNERSRAATDLEPHLADAGGEALNVADIAAMPLADADVGDPPGLGALQRRQFGLGGKLAEHSHCP